MDPVLVGAAAVVGLFGAGLIVELRRRHRAERVISARSERVQLDRDDPEDKLRTALHGHHDPAMRARAFQILWERGATVSLEDALRSPHVEVRTAAAAALIERPASAALSPTAGDPFRSLPASVATAVFDITSTWTRSDHPLERRLALRTLLAIDRNRGLPLVLDALRDPQPALGELAAQELRRRAIIPDDKLDRSLLHAYLSEWADVAKLHPRLLDAPSELRQLILYRLELLPELELVAFTEHPYLKDMATRCLARRRGTTST
jgi:hypothetical protein